MSGLWVSFLSAGNPPSQTASNQPVPMVLAPWLVIRGLNGRLAQGRVLGIARAPAQAVERALVRRVVVGEAHEGADVLFLTKTFPAKSGAFRVAAAPAEVPEEGVDVEEAAPRGGDRLPDSLLDGAAKILYRPIGELFGGSKGLGRPRFGHLDPSP